MAIKHSGLIIREINPKLAKLMVLRASLLLAAITSTYSMAGYIDICVCMCKHVCVCVCMYIYVCICVCDLQYYGEIVRDER